MTSTIESPFPRIDRPCPDWCTLSAGHGWDSAEPTKDVISRGHGGGSVGEANQWTVDLYMIEEADVPHVIRDAPESWDGYEGEPGPSRFPGGPMVGLDANGGAYTPAQARQIAAALLDAADRLDAQQA